MAAVVADVGGCQRRRVGHEFARDRSRGGGPGSRLLVASPLLTEQVKMAARDGGCPRPGRRDRAPAAPSLEMAGSPRPQV